MKICVMGNSHVGSLKRGWDEVRTNYREHEITFFAQRSDGLEGLIAQNGKLIPNNEKLASALEFTSGGKKEIEPKEYDVFVIYGAGVNINWVVENHFYSNAVIESSLNDLVTNTLSFHLLQRLRALTNKPVFIGHLPLVPAVEVLSDTRPSDYIARVERINEIAYRPLGAELVRQPLSTIVNGNKTHPDFSKGSKALAVGDSGDNVSHPESDSDHMNDKFGEIWLREFLTEYVGKVESRAPARGIRQSG
jgi:hypothetical protein